MSLRKFIFGLSASFGVAWLAVVIIPFFKMRNLEPVALSEEPDSGYFYPKRTGRITDGAWVYAQNGCYQCHTQLVRPTYAGTDLFRPDWGGLKSDPERGDTRRETNAFDFYGESFAQIGVMRLGPDLSNIGRRVESVYALNSDPTAWLYRFLYNPRNDPRREYSFCPPMRFLFIERKVTGNPSQDAIATAEDGQEIVPGPEAQALVSYLLSLKKDHPVPPVFDFGPPRATPVKQ